MHPLACCLSIGVNNGLLSVVMLDAWDFLKLLSFLYGLTGRLGEVCRVN